MGLRIQNNIEAFNTHRQLTATVDAGLEVDGEALQRLPHQPCRRRRRRPRASREKMRGQIGGLAQAQRNAQDGISLVQTAEGALNEVHSMLQRVRDLKVQFNNGTLSTTTRTRSPPRSSQIAKEVKNIVDRHRSSTAQPLFGAADVHVPGRRQRRRDDLHDGRRPQPRAATPPPAACPS